MPLSQTEVALEAWALLQELPVAPAGNSLAASLPNLRSEDAIEEQTLWVLSQTCPGRQGNSEVPLTLEKTLQRSRGKEGDVHFLNFWRSLGEVSQEVEVASEVCTRSLSAERSPRGVEADHTLPIGPLGPAGPVQPSVERTTSVMEELENLRDIMLDHFETGGDLPVAKLQEVVRSFQMKSTAPQFWQKLYSQLSQDREAGECLNLSDLTVLLLLWLREAAAWELSPGVASETPESEDLSLLAQHLQQALDTETPARTLENGYESGTQLQPNWSNPNLRSAMLTLGGEMAELQAASGPRGWMRSALLPRFDDPETGRSDQETVTTPSSLPGPRDAANSAPEPGQNAGEWKLLMPDLSTRPTSPLPVLEPLRARGMPVLLHIYDVTQERAIRRLNKVLAHKHMPLKFGGIFHAGVEVSGTEWSYGCTESEDEPGVLPNLPKMHPDHHYRQTVEMRRTTLSATEVGDILEELSAEYTGPSYDLLRKNCCHFADVFCQRLGAGGIPAWVYRLARIASRIENLLQAAQRIRLVG